MSAEETGEPQASDAADEFDLDIRLMPGLYGDGLHAMPGGPKEKSGQEHCNNTVEHTNCGTKCTACIDPTRTCENCNKTSYTHCGSCGCHTERTCEGCPSYASECKTCQGPCGSQYGACTG